MKQGRKIFFELGKTSRNIKRLLDTGKNKSYIDKITGNHGHIIGFIYENSEKDLFQKDIEKKFNIRPSTASNMLRFFDSIKRINKIQDAELLLQGAYAGFASLKGIDSSRLDWTGDI